MKSSKSSVLTALLLLFILIQGCSSPASEITGAPASPAPAPEIPFVTPVPEAEAVVREPYINEIKSRYYSDVMLGLVAKNDYGEIYPYIGGFYRSQFTYAIEYLYGVVDYRGRIICDPVYNDVSLLDGPNGEQIYLFRKLGKSTNENYEVGGLFVLAATDGSWVRRFEQAHYSDYMTEPVIFDYIAVCSDGKWGAIDYAGNDILPCEYKSPPLFREGLAAVLTDDEASYVYIDKSGRTILGPYPLPPETPRQFNEDRVLLEKMFFSNDRALYFENGKYGFIDKQGNIAVEPQFTERYRRLIFEEGSAVVCDAEELSGDLREYYGVIDTDGNFIIPMEMNYIISRGNGEFLCDTGDESLIYDAAGNITPYENFYEIGGGWSILPTDSGGLIIKGNGTEQIFENAHNAFFLEGDKFVINHTDPRSLSIENMSGKIYLSSTDAYMDWSVRDNVIFTYLPESSVSNPLQYGKFGILDFDGNTIIPQEYNYLDPIGENYAATQGIYGGLINGKGEWVIKVSLLDYLDD